MTPLQAIVLGALQGLTEFLPISSSGHLVLFQQLFGLHAPALLFDLLVHVATLLAVIMMYRCDLWTILSAWFSTSTSSPTRARDAAWDGARARRLGLCVIVANIPTAIIGLTFEPIFERFFTTTWIVGVALLVTGTLLWCLRYIPAQDHQTVEVGYGQALLLGTVQAVALIPGISRSGSTIAVALLCGVSRAPAARFSFLMAIPAIAGAALIKGSSATALSTHQMAPIVLGMLSALVVGYGALYFLLRLVTQGSLWRFAIYCWCVGLGVLVISL